MKKSVLLLAINTKQAGMLMTKLQNFRTPNTIDSTLLVGTHG